MIFHLWIFNEQKNQLFTKLFTPNKGEIVPTECQTANLTAFVPVLLNLMDLTRTSDSFTNFRTFTIAGLQAHIYFMSKYFIIVTTVNGLKAQIFLEFVQNLTILLIESSNREPTLGFDKNPYFQNEIELLIMNYESSLGKSQETTNISSEIEFWDGMNIFDETDISKTKYLFLGTAKAGKSSIYFNFFEDWSQDQLTSIKPTVNKWISQYEDEYTENPFLIFDLGGQEQYRKEHLLNKSLFQNLRSLIFVIDIQDEFNQQSVIDYFKSILEVVEQNNESPHLMVYLHKFDPDLYETLYPKIKIWMDNLKDVFYEYPQTTYYLTSIKDNSAKEAMSRTLLLTIPRQLLIRSMNPDLLVEVAQSVSDLVKKVTEEKLIDKIQQIKDQIYRKSISFGYETAQKTITNWVHSIFQKSAINHPELKISTMSPKIKLKTADRRVAIYFESQLPTEVKNHPAIIEITNGLLEGLGNIIGLNDPRFLQNNLNDDSISCLVEMSFK